MIVFSSRNNSPFGGLGCLIFGILGLVALFYILRGLYFLLWWAAPVLFALALILNWRLVAETGKSFIRLLQHRPLSGILLALISIFAFPLLALYLFLAALGGRRMAQATGRFGAPFNAGGRNAQPQPEDEFVEFEEIESKPKKHGKTDGQNGAPPADRNKYEDLIE
jgi:hypothetical protein